MRAIGAAGAGEVVDEVAQESVEEVMARTIGGYEDVLAVVTELDPRPAFAWFLSA